MVLCRSRATPYIFVNRKLDDQEMLSEMLAQNVRHGVTIRMPQKGILTQLVKDAEKMRAKRWR